MARKNKRINVLDLFSGIGGFALGIEKTGIKHEWLGFSEIDKYASELYKRRFPNAKELGSVENISYESLKGQKINLLTGGFPCQAFSIAGKRQGFEDTRGTLFFEIARILEDYIKNGKPIPCILLENVKGLLSHDNKRTFITIYKILADLNYTLECQVVNTRWFLPQNRERIFIFGRYNGRRSGRKVFPIGKNDIKVGFKGLNQIGNLGKDNQANRVYNINGVSKTITDGGGGGAKTGLYEVTTHSLYPRSSKTGKGGTGHLTKEDGTAYCLDTGNAQAIEFKTYGIIPESDKPKGNWLPRERVLESNNGLSRAISTSQSQHPYYTDKTRIRRLTPLECERLQGFPDNWTEGQSDTQRYKQCGNAVSVPVIEAIIRKIYDL
jgi:DNA (cytosine-5)-methyltransferase 1